MLDGKSCQESAANGDPGGLSFDPDESVNQNPPVGIWDVEGTGSRIFGQEVASKASEQSQNNEKWTKVSAKTKKKRDKRLQQEKRETEDASKDAIPALEALSL